MGHGIVRVLWDIGWIIAGLVWLYWFVGLIRYHRKWKRDGVPPKHWLGWYES